MKANFDTDDNNQIIYEFLQLLSMSNQNWQVEQ